MTSITLVVPDIVCGHCVARIRQALDRTPGVIVHAIDQRRRRVTVTIVAPTTLAEVRRILDEEGYPVSDAQQAAA